MHHLMMMRVRPYYLYQFAVTSGMVAVTREGFRPASVNDLIVGTSPLCRT